MKMPPVDMLPKFTKGDPWYKRLHAWFSRRRWIFREDYLIDLPDGRQAHIPQGFILDFASVPRIFAWLFPPFGPLMMGAVVHDYIYKRSHLLIVMNQNMIKEGFSRRQADQLLYAITADQTGIKIGALTAWAGVRVGGWFAWKG